MTREKCEACEGDGVIQRQAAYIMSDLYSMWMEKCKTCNGTGVKQ